MQIRTGKGVLVAVAIFAAAFSSWQFADGGLTFVRGQLPLLLGDKGRAVHAVAFRARYEKNQRTYWLFTTSDRGSSLHRVVVIYGPDRQPLEAKLLSAMTPNPSFKRTPGGAA